MSDTPETDVYWDQVCDTAARWDVNEGHTKLLQHARRLERERDAERALADRLAEELEKLAWLAGHEVPNEAEKALTAWKEARGE